jgi:hypothetical protein
MKEGNADYPSYGQYGDPRPRCQWCGSVNVPASHTFQFGEYGYYCSWECSMAGRYHQMLGGVLFAIPVFAISSFVLINASLPLVSIDSRPMLLSLGITVFFVFLTYWFIDSIRVGYSMRQTTEQGYVEHGRLDEDDAKDLEKSILSIIDSDSGVNLSELQTELGEKYSRASIRWILDILLVSGKIEEIELGHYRINKETTEQLPQ